MTINIKNCLLLLPLMTSCNKLSKYDVGPEAEVYQNESVNSGRNIEKNMSSSKMITKEQKEILDMLISGNVEKVLSDIKEKHLEDELLKGEGYCYSDGMAKDGYNILAFIIVQKYFVDKSDQIEYYATADHHEDIEKQANNLSFYPKECYHQAKRFNDTKYFKELFEILIKKEISIIDQVNSNNNYLLAAIYKIMEGKNLQGKRSKDCTKEDLTKLNKYQKQALDEIISILASHPDFKKWSETSYDSGRGPISKHFKNKNVLAYAQEVGLSQQTIKILS